MEEQIYYWVGKVAVWLCVSIVAFIVGRWLFIKTINILGDIFDKMWILHEFLYYRNDFKEWVKDKERHPKLKKH